MKAPKPVVMYDLLYIVDGKVKEVVLENKPITICRWKISVLKKTTHTIGLLQPRKTANKPKGGWIK